MGTLSFSLSSLFLSAAVFLIFLKADSKTFWRDIQVLQELKKGLDPSSVTPGSCLSSWDFAVDPCDNLFSDRFTCGFRCDTVVTGASRVTELSLDQAGYAGPLASSFDLPYLETLDLAGNYFSGAIPDSLSNLTRLRRLSLSRNSFSGEIPDSLGLINKLEELCLGNNNLQGRIPSTLNNLLSLNRLELQNNGLTGELPELGRLQNLYFFDTSNNWISGQIPNALPVSLVQLSMRNNSLEGSIPESFKQLRYLQVLDLSHNKISDSVPVFLFTHPSLQQLTLSFNQLSSIQPPKSLWTTVSELIAVDLSNNQIKGLLPSFMGTMPKLAALSLENNKFTGMIPTLYALKAVLPGTGVSQFARLLLGGNYLFGPIPPPLLGLKPESSVNVSLTDNCLFRCPRSFFFCQGGGQKSIDECKKFRTVIMP